MPVTGRLFRYTTLNRIEPSGKEDFMRIEIKTEKVLESGGAMKRRVLYIRAARKSELPPEYFEATPAVWLEVSPSFKLCNNAGASPLICNNDYSEAIFQGCLDRARRAGERLRAINESRRALLRSWRGEETFVI